MLIIANDVEFGRPEHGFLVTNAGNTGGGIVIDGTDVKVRGNQAVHSGPIEGKGIETVNNPSEIVLIEQNQVIGWSIGILVRDAGKKVSKNQVSQNNTGIAALGGSIVGNVATANGSGIQLLGAASAVGNATYGNFFGFDVQSPFTGVIQKNNIFGNHPCGLLNNVAGLVATGNYWGAATGPGPDPADAVCNGEGKTTTTTPFATARFAINPSFEP